MSAITVAVSNTHVLAVLDQISAALTDPAPLLAAFGEDLAESTKRRFATSTAPDGARWPANLQATFEAYLARISSIYSPQGERTGTRKGYFKKNGQLGAKGSAAMSGKKPLIGESKALSTTIYYHVQARACSQ